MLAAIVSISLLAALLGGALGYAAIRLRVDSDPTVERINALLPQTQCGQCGFAGCRPYAAAIASGEADINRCPPGGEATLLALSKLLAREPKALDERYGAHVENQIAVIDEQRCIGCTLCVQACPVDAILGSSQQMHAVIQQECTGCGLCLAPCPVDCISMHTLPLTIDNCGWAAPTTSDLSSYR